MQFEALKLPAAVLRASASMVVEAGERIFRVGDKAHSVYFVEQGSVRLVRYGRAGEEVPLHHARAGEFFAEASLDTTHYHCDSVACERGQLVRIPASALQKLLGSDAEFSRQWAMLLARQLRVTRARVERLSLKSASERVRHLLGSEGRGRHCEYAYDGTLKDLARVLGLTHEALYRTLAAMEREGVLERDEGVLRLVR